MNVQQLTGCQFGGKNLDTLYVNTCGLDMYGQQVYPAGFLMKVTNVGTHGVEMHKFMMNWTFVEWFWNKNRTEIEKYVFFILFKITASILIAHKNTWSSPLSDSQ